MVVMRRAVSAEMTLRTAVGANSRTVSPLTSTNFFTMWGCMSTPSLAMAERAETSWMAVTEIPWPKATVEVSTWVQFFQGEADPKSRRAARCSFSGRSRNS